MTTPVMSYADFQLSRGFSGYADQAQAPVPRLPPVPPPVGPPSPYQPPGVGGDSYDAAQPLPYDPNAAPTRSWDLAPSNVITPMDPNRGKSLDEIPPALGWSRLPSRGY